MSRFPRPLLWSLTAGLLLLSGCTGLYFRDAGSPTSPPRGCTLATLPFSEYWTGIVFNGARVGFSRLSVSPSSSAPHRFEIRSEAALHFRFLLFEKRVVLKSVDTVAEDLSLVAFAYDYDLDGNTMAISGERVQGGLETAIVSRGQKTSKFIPINEKLYPAGIVGLYPVLHGLKVGARYAYWVFSGETQTIEEVRQEIQAYEESDLFPEKAFKVATEFLGQTVTTWIDEKGRPVLEISLNGVVISALESEKEAKGYLAQASLNKQDVLLDFSLIRTDVPIRNPERLTKLEVILSGMPEEFAPPDDGVQQCTRLDEGIRCRMEIPGLDAPLAKLDGPSLKAEAAQYLKPSYAVPSIAPIIRETALLIAGEARSTRDKILSLVQWIQDNIHKEPVDAFTALDVLARRKAECQGHSYLYAAFARSLGIPTRVVNGIVYSEDHGGFLYHTWAESLVEGTWIPVDPTLDQIPADATHIKLIEGETLQDLVPLATLIGRIQIKILSWIHRF